MELSGRITIWRQLQRYQAGLSGEIPFRSKAEVSGGTIKCTYHLKVKVQVSGRTISWDYLLEAKQRYKLEL